jgi:hypothetical protein
MIGSKFFINGTTAQAPVLIVLAKRQPLKLCIVAAIIFYSSASLVISDSALFWISLCPQATIFRFALWIVDSPLAAALYVSLLVVHVPLTGIVGVLFAPLLLGCLASFGVSLSVLAVSLFDSVFFCFSICFAAILTLIIQPVSGSALFVEFASGLVFFTGGAFLVWNAVNINSSHVSLYGKGNPLKLAVLLSEQHHLGSWGLCIKSKFRLMNNWTLPRHLYCIVFRTTVKVAAHQADGGQRIGLGVEKLAKYVAVCLERFTDRLGLEPELVSNV